MKMDKSFLKRFIRLTIPFSLQLLIASAVNLVDVMMIGRLGDASIAAAGSANQIFFLLTIIQFGIGSGASVFIAQYWGAGEEGRVKKVLGLMYGISGLVSLFFVIISLWIPGQIIGFYIKDQEAIRLGTQYLMIVCISYLFTAISTSLATVCRCTGDVGLPTFAGILSMAINVLGNAILIFGLWGVRPMGLVGAAIATVFARLAEMLILVVVIYSRQKIGAARLRELIHWEPGFLRMYLKKASPVLINEVLWSFGTSLYMVAFGYMGTSAVAAVQIATAIAQILFVFVRGAGNAVAVMLGNTIGEGKEEQALKDSITFLIILPLMGVAVSVLLVLFKNPLLWLYQVTPETEVLVSQLILLHALMFVPKAFSVVMIVGILRSGGDTYYAFLLDVLPVWLFSVPMGFLAVWLGAPVWVVFLLVNGEDVLKPFWGIPRVLSRKWMHNLTKEVVS